MDFEEWFEKEYALTLACILPPLRMSFKEIAQNAWNNSLPRWVSVNERLPLNPNEKYLVKFDNCQNKKFKTFYRKYLGNGEWEFIKLETITHWLEDE